MNVKSLVCDYLVIGSGAASMAFIDTLLTEQPQAKVVLVDKNPAPGGHWVHAYDFVKLHQPSLLYGIASKQLEGNWLGLMFRKFTLPWNHRATKTEILDYFDTFLQERIAAGQVDYYPNCQYDFPTSDSNTPEATDGAVQTHFFHSIVEGDKQYSVHVHAKLVNGILGENKIPSLDPVRFPVDERLCLLTPNQLVDHPVSRKTRGKRYVILGAGKTAMDTVVYLQKVKKVHPAKISWVIPNDVWMMLREGGGRPWTWPESLLEHGGNEEKAGLALEKEGAFVRLDPKVVPSAFRFPVIGKSELKLMRKVTHRIRRGRVCRICIDENNKAVLEFEAQKTSDGSQLQPEDWTMTEDRDEVIFVHCTSPGPFNDNEVEELFRSRSRMDLSLLFPPPVSISMSTLAYLESARANGKLDVEFGRRLLDTLYPKHHTTTTTRILQESALPRCTEEDVLKPLVQGLDMMAGLKSSEYRSILNTAFFLALADEDPMVPYQWMCQNRLSFLSIPGVKSGIYEMLGKFLEPETNQILGYSSNELAMIALLRDKLQVLEGK